MIQSSPHYFSVNALMFRCFSTIYTRKQWSLLFFKPKKSSKKPDSKKPDVKKSKKASAIKGKMEEETEAAPAVEAEIKGIFH